MNKQYALVFDLSRCIGCQTCVIACKVQNNLRVGCQWLKVLEIREGVYPQLRTHWEPITCMHCKDPACVEACPEEAIYKDGDGIVLIHKSKCTGCLICQPACPYDAIQFDPDENVVEKCNLCQSRVEDNLPPFCVKECIWGAIHFGDVSDLKSEVSCLITERKGFLLLPESDCRPSNHYLPPNG